MVEYSVVLSYSTSEITDFTSITLATHIQDPPKTLVWLSPA